MIQIVLHIALELSSLGPDVCNCPKILYCCESLNGFTIFQNSDRKFLPFEYCLYNVPWSSKFVGLISICVLFSF